MLPVYQIFRDNRGEYRFRLLSVQNSEIILAASEGYVDLRDCKRAIEICQVNSTNDKYFERKYNGSHYYFALNANNGEEIGRSVMYTTLYNRDNGIEAVKRDGQT